MIRHGEAPYLECSSKGDRRFSAFHARVNGNSIENLYQAFKVFENGETGLSWRNAKGRKPVNIEECRQYYSRLWRKYIRANPMLLLVLKEATGLSDIFGQDGSVCQATELWNIRNKYKLVNGKLHRLQLKDKGRGFRREVLPHERG